MLRKYQAIVIMTAAMLVVSVVAPPAFAAGTKLALESPVVAQSGGANPHTPAVGTYLSELVLDGSGLVVKALTVFEDNGTLVTTDTTDFGLGGLTPGFDSPTMGVWKKTGPFEVTQRTIYFSYDTAGTHTGTVVSTVVSTGDNEFSTFTGTFTAEFFLPSQDPLTELGFPAGSGTFTSRKVTIP